VQLFDDRPGYEPSSPLSLAISNPTRTCTEVFTVTATATGGLSPYSFVWTGASPSSASSDPSNTASVWTYQTATVRVTSADGQTATRSLYYEPYCTGGEQLP
jgi:hypothetical protein